MPDDLDRESLREETRRWTEHQRLLAIERMVEQVPAPMLERLLDGLAHLEQHRLQSDVLSPALRDRVDAHIASTRRGKFLGELEMGKRWGDREPWQTQAWIAATAHLFDLLLDRAQQNGNEAALRGLVSLLDEVDELADELVAFDQEGAGSVWPRARLPGLTGMSAQAKVHSSTA